MKLLSRVPLFVTPWTAAYRTPLSMGFSRQEYWSGLPFPSPESESEVAQSYPTLRDPVDCTPPGSSIHGILQARILEWVAISSSRGSSQPRDQIEVSCVAGRRFNLWATREAPQKKPHPWHGSWHVKFTELAWAWGDLGCYSGFAHSCVTLFMFHYLSEP